MRASSSGGQIALEAIAVSINHVDALNDKPGSAPRWLGIALIVWLGGAAVGVATLPSDDRPAGTARPPAHRPIDMESPTGHDLPALA
jgi:hypothetical protein